MIENCDGVKGMHWANPNLFLCSFARLPTFVVVGFDVYPCLEYYNV